MIIELTKNMSCIIDDEDYKTIKDHSWHVTSNGYAACRSNGHIVLMHRLIINTPKGMVTDHINGDRLDNRKYNLRICTQGQNLKNRTKRIIKQSKYKGVHITPKCKLKWTAEITLDREHIYLGRFNTELEAAKAYNKAAIKLFGEYANLNDIE